MTEWLTLGPGVGEPYVPTVIGPDGMVFTLNGGTMWALGSLNAVGVAVTSSIPDARAVVVGQSLTLQRQRQLQPQHVFRPDAGGK